MQTSQTWFPLQLHHYKYAQPMQVISYKHYAVKIMFVFKFSCSYLKHFNVNEVFKFLGEMFNNSCDKSSSGIFYLLYLKFKINNPAESEI